MLYLYNKVTGQIINAGNAHHIERAKITYGHRSQLRWHWIVKSGSREKAIVKYYPCNEYDFHMMT